ncbi:MAG: XdhC family protein, partial [Arenicellales bacterium]|nr:XdhC family protein [Arenicellales bacterium]
SRKTHARRLARLAEAGIASAELARIHAPIGLDLGGRKPADIAIAILAEIVSVRSGSADGL